MELESDSELMVAVKGGNRAAFATLFRRYSRPLFRFVLRFVGDPSMGEELVQDIFFKIYKSAPTYEPRASFVSFLYRVATNHCLNELRRGVYRERFDSIEQPRFSPEERPLELADPRDPGAEKIILGQEMYERLQQILLELPENQCAAVLLNRFEHLSYQETAESLELSVGAVKSLLNRARNTIRYRLEESDAL